MREWYLRCDQIDSQLNRIASSREALSIIPDDGTDEKHVQHDKHEYNNNDNNNNFEEMSELYMHYS